MTVVNQNSEPIKLTNNIRRLNGKVNDHLVYVGVAISLANDERCLTLIDFLNQARGVVLFR